MITPILNKLSEFDVVYVTGPQRSGTTFVSNYLSKKLGYKLIDEADYEINSFVKMQALINEAGKCVVQCPAQSHNILKFGDTNSIVVYMIRDVFDIIKSEIRINWNKQGARDREYAKYSKHFPTYTLSEIPISVIKYKVWEEVQKPHINNYIELKYSDLNTIDGWLNPIDRKQFKSKQIN